MNEQQLQPISPHDPIKEANHAAASLSFATNLQDQMLQHQNPVQKQTQTASTSPQNAPGQEQTPEYDPISKLVKEVDELRKEVKGKVADEEINKIRDELESLLKDESNEQPNETPE